VNIASQIAAVKATQGALAVEQRMLAEAFRGPPAGGALPGAVLNYSDFVVARRPAPPPRFRPDP
jgi:hypothetical protein